jgi:hypothetical protein
MAGVRFEICRARGADTGHPAYLWRLLSSNNIEVGRSGAAFDDVESCRCRIRRVAQGVGWQAVLNGGHGRWTWRLRSGHTELAVSSRGYPRRAEAEQAVRRFIHLAISSRATVVTRLPALPPPGLGGPSESAPTIGGPPPRPVAAGHALSGHTSPAGRDVLAVQFADEAYGEGIELLRNV